MYDAEANAKAIERVRAKNKERMRRAYTHIFSSPEGRAFIHDLAETCRFYSSTKNLMEEGQRQIAIGIRDKAIELGFFGEWQRAEREVEEYRHEIRRILEQTEEKENENY
ncbi:MAG: hypothetical protein IJI45_11535 [Anaerolineaceae bacterium]|nr:hypothetical protein [Anaerolineaceae bacterium]